MALRSPEVVHGDYTSLKRRRSTSPRETRFTRRKLFAARSSCFHGAREKGGKEKPATRACTKTPLGQMGAMAWGDHGYHAPHEKAATAKLHAARCHHRAIESNPGTRLGYTREPLRTLLWPLQAISA